MRLGAFRLEEPIGRGGMGVVFRAVHPEQGLVAALKVMSCDPEARTEFTARFRDEVRAVAALDHPNIAMILDHGVVDEEAARATGLPAGSPWFAMEHAPGGTLSKWPDGSFADLKRAWLRILDALAHAHARGVVHRDLKPGNILLAGPAEQRPPLKLVDFGVAFARLHGDKTGPVDEHVVGTPRYMAPEQLRGEWRDQGPWTDLYALGCLCWRQLTGKTPFSGRTAAETMVGHLTRDLPRLAPRIPVPPGVEDWLRGLLEKEPTRRYQRAADVAHALAAMGEAVEAEPSSTIPDWEETGVFERPRVAPSPAPSSAAVRPPPAPMPSDWRREEPPPPPLALVGAGIRLFGLRRVPLVGRETERDRLWAELGEVTRSGRSRVVVVRGPAGTGKSALVQWLCERAHETGAASWSRATFAPGLAQGEPLHRMGIGFLRTKGLPRPEVRERVVRFLASHGSSDPHEAAVLTELLHAARPEDLEVGERPVRLTRVREYYAGTANTMRRAASERPLVTWLDDVQWGIHGIGLATQVLRSRDEQPAPVLVVLTVRDEALVPGSIEQDRLDKLLALPGATAIPLGPLPREATGELVSRLVVLEPELAARVIERTAGNPLFAVQLLAALVKRGDLRRGERGFELAPGAAPDLPEDVAAVWQGHLRRILAEYPPQAETYLEIAAVLGTPVDRREWRKACDDPDDFFGDRFAGEEPLRARLVERLIEERLAVRTPQGWAFVHGMLEEALVAAAARGARLVAHHGAAATVLARRAEEPDVAERLGVHLLAAGRPAEAVEPLLRGIEVRWVATGVLSALALLPRARDAVGTLPPDDPRRGRLHVLAAALHLEHGDAESARAAADAALEGAERYGWSVWRAREVRAALALRSGDVAEAEAEWQAMGAADDAAARARGEKGLGQLARRRGLAAEAVERFTGAAGRFDALGEPVEAAWCTLLRGRVQLAAGDAEAARDAFAEARRRFEAQGAAAGAAEALDGLARVERAAGRAAEAEVLLRDALARYEALGAAHKAYVARLRLAVWLSLDRRIAEVPALVERASHLGGADLASREVLHDATRWASAALRGDLPAWDEAFEAVASGVWRLATPRRALAAESVAWLAQVAAALLPSRERDRADRALAGVRAVQEALRRPDLVEEMEQAWASRV